MRRHALAAFLRLIPIPVDIVLVEDGRSDAHGRLLQRGAGLPRPRVQGRYPPSAADRRVGVRSRSEGISPCRGEGVCPGWRRCTRRR
jgi:hypothetical protein